MTVSSELPAGGAGPGEPAGFPTLGEVVEELAEWAEVDSLDPTTLLPDLGVESFDLLEWAYALADRYQLDVGEEIFDGAENLCLQDIYVRVKALYRPAH